MDCYFSFFPVVRAVHTDGTVGKESTVRMLCRVSSACIMHTSVLCVLGVHGSGGFVQRVCVPHMRAVVAQVRRVLYGGVMLCYAMQAWITIGTSARTPEIGDWRWIGWTWGWIR